MHGSTISMLRWKRPGHEAAVTLGELGVAVVEAEGHESVEAEQYYRGNQ